MPWAPAIAKNLEQRFSDTKSPTGFAISGGVPSGLINTSQGFDSVQRLGNSVKIKYLVLEVFLAPTNASSSQAFPQTAKVIVNINRSMGTVATPNYIVLQDATDISVAGGMALAPNEHTFQNPIRMQQIPMLYQRSIGTPAYSTSAGSVFTGIAELPDTIEGGSRCKLLIDLSAANYVEKWNTAGQNTTDVLEWMIVGDTSIMTATVYFMGRAFFETG